MPITYSLVCIWRKVSILKGFKGTKMCDSNQSFAHLSFFIEPRDLVWIDDIFFWTLPLQEMIFDRLFLAFLVLCGPKKPKNHTYTPKNSVPNNINRSSSKIRRELQLRVAKIFKNGRSNNQVVKTWELPLPPVIHVRPSFKFVLNTILKKLCTCVKSNKFFLLRGFLPTKTCTKIDAATTWQEPWSFSCYCF